MHSLNATRWVLFVVIVLFLGLTVGTAADRAPPVLASSVVGKSSAPVYSPGGTFAGTWRVKAVRPCDGTAERWIVVMRADGGPPWTYRLPDVPVRLTDQAELIPGPIEYPITAFSLPPDTPAGSARYFHVDHYACSWPGQWLFPITVVYQPIDFRVDASAREGP